MAGLLTTIGSPISSGWINHHHQFTNQQSLDQSPSFHQSAVAGLITAISSSISSGWIIHHHYFNSSALDGSHTSIDHTDMTDTSPLWLDALIKFLYRTNNSNSRTTLHSCLFPLILILYKPCIYLDGSNVNVITKEYTQSCVTTKERLLEFFAHKIISEYVKNGRLPEKLSA